MVAYVPGIILLTSVHRDRIALSVIHGGKRPLALEVGITRAHRDDGLVFFALSTGFVFRINKNYDPTRQTQNYLGSAHSVR